LMAVHDCTPLLPNLRVSLVSFQFFLFLLSGR
jgi:hypothetical protein